MISWRVGWSLAAASVGVTTAAAQGDGVMTLVRDGQPVATIVTAAKAGPVTQFAAAELQYHVRRITGATLPVVTDAVPTTGPRVLVGESQATRALRMRSREFQTQEYAIRFLTGPVTSGRPAAEPVLVLLGREDRNRAAGPDRPARVDGKFGQALEFDGRQDVFTVADCGFSDEAGTMEAWVWIPAEKQEKCHGTILRLDGADPWTYHIIQRDLDSSRISYTTYDGTNGYSLSSGELAEGWYHVMGTHDAAAGVMEFFVDGVSVGQTRYVKTTCKGAVLGLGGMPSSGSVGNPLRGRLDEVRLSKVVRRPAEARGGPYVPDDQTSCLFHFDEAEGLPVDFAGATVGVNPPPLFGENGTLYAVYDFLERFCDVRWYAPGELGLVCPHQATLVVKAKAGGAKRVDDGLHPERRVGGSDSPQGRRGMWEVRHQPAMIHRWITPTPLYLPGPPTQAPARDVETWKLRMRIGGQAFWVCHSFYGYYDRFLKDHPDWFAQGYPGQPPQMCYTNEDFIQQVIQDARDYFDGKGKQPGATAEGDVFGLVPQDNMSWCKCARCQAQLNPAEMDNQQFNNGKASDYIFHFVNRVAREVRQTHPDKWIGALAYSDYAYYPTKEKVEPNVVVQMCLHTRNWWCPSMEANDRKVLHDWRTQDPDRPLYLWLYYCFPALNAKYGPYHYFPGYFAHTVVKQMRLYRQARIQGIFMEHSGEFGESFLMDQLEFYVTLKLAQHRSANSLHRKVGSRRATAGV